MKIFLLNWFWVAVAAAALVLSIPTAGSTKSNDPKWTTGMHVK